MVTPLEAHRHRIQEALVHLAAAGVRYLDAAAALLDSGFVPECGVLIRPLYEIARDAGLLLGANGEERRYLTERFHAGRDVRSLTARFGGGPIEDYQRIREAIDLEFGSAAPWVAQEHWSGWGHKKIKQKVEAALAARFDGFAFSQAREPLQTWGHIVAHFDPGAWMHYPIASGTRRILVDSRAADPRAWFVVGARSAVLAASILMLRLPKEKQDGFRPLAASAMEGTLILPADWRSE